MGYGGSGPAQLALALLAHAVGPEKAMECYQEFKFKHIATLPRNETWRMTRLEVIDKAMAILEGRVSA